MNSILKGLVVAASLALISGCDKRSEDETVFGIKMGDPISSLSASEQIGKDQNFVIPFNYKIRPREPNTSFNTYAAFATPKQGICAILASSYEVRPSEFATVRDVLIEKYGQPESDPAVVSDYWFPTTDSDSSKAKSIQMIMLSRLGDAMTLRYQFSNYETCAKELSASGL
jgi:hypothetical protein